MDLQSRSGASTRPAGFQDVQHMEHVFLQLPAPLQRGSPAILLARLCWPLQQQQAGQQGHPVSRLLHSIDM